MPQEPEANTTPRERGIRKDAKRTSGITSCRRRLVRTAGLGGGRGAETTVVESNHPSVG
jgi:hypothetical protein